MRRRILRILIPFLALSYLFRPLVNSPIRGLLTDVFGRMSYIGVNIPMLYRLYTQSTRFGTLRYTIAFEMVLCIAKATTAWVLVFVFASVAPGAGFIIAFSMAAALTFFYMFL